MRAKFLVIGLYNLVEDKFVLGRLKNKRVEA